MDNTQTKNLTNTQNPNDSVSVGKSSTPPINTVGLRTTPVSTMQVMMTQEMDEVKEFVDNANVYTSISQITIENQYLIIYFTNGLTFNCGRVKGTDGKTPVIEIGTITTLDPGKQATGDIVHIGETEDGSPLYRLDLSIPKGDKGDAGDSASGNVQVTTGNLLSGRQYAFVPSENGSANGSFVEIVTNEAPSDGNAYGQKNKAWVKVVEHEDGKGLSTNDLTNELLDRINNLVNYDDTTIKAEIENIKKQLDTLFGEGVSDAIDTFNEIEEFLAGISDSQSLNDILNSLSENIIKLIPTKLSDLQNDANYVSDAYYVHTDNNFSTLEKAKLEGLENYDDSTIRGEINNVKSNLDQKQDKLVSGTSIKTVNGQSILGEGNISIEAPEQRQADWNETNPESTAFIKNKPTIPNIDVDKAYVDSQISGVNAAISEANGKIDGKVDKVDGKQLSTNDYTTEDKNKLDGIEDGANNYKLPNATNLILGGVKIGDNISGNSGVISLTKQNVISALGFDPSQSDMMLNITDWLSRIIFSDPISDEDLVLLDEYLNSGKIWYFVTKENVIVNYRIVNENITKIFYTALSGNYDDYTVSLLVIDKTSKTSTFTNYFLPKNSDVPTIRLDNYQKPSQYTSISSSDSIIKAIGKLEAGIGECNDIVDITDLFIKMENESGTIEQEDYDLLKSYIEEGKLFLINQHNGTNTVIQYISSSSYINLFACVPYGNSFIRIDIKIYNDLNYNKSSYLFLSSHEIADNTFLDGYSKHSSYTPIEPTDTINSAIGKLEAGLSTAGGGLVDVGEIMNRLMNLEDGTTVSSEDINTLRGHIDSGTRMYVMLYGSLMLYVEGYYNGNDKSNIGLSAFASSNVVGDPDIAIFKFEISIIDGKKQGRGTGLTSYDNYIGKNGRITGYERPTSTSVIISSDTINEAIGKLEAGVMEALHTQPNPKWVAFCEVVNKIMTDITSSGSGIASIAVTQEDINILKAPLVGKVGFQDFVPYMTFKFMGDVPVNKALALYSEETKDIAIAIDPLYPPYDYSYVITINEETMLASFIVDMKALSLYDGDLSISVGGIDGSGTPSSFSIDLKTSGDGTKALMDNGQYMEVGTGSGGGIPEAPADGKVYGRDGSRKSWVEVANGDDVVVLNFTTGYFPGDGDKISVTAEQFTKISNAANNHCDIVVVFPCSVVRSKAIEWVGNAIDDPTSFPVVSIYFEVPSLTAEDENDKNNPPIQIRVDINTTANEDGNYEGVTRIIREYPIIEDVDFSLATEEGVDISSNILFKETFNSHIAHTGKLMVCSKRNSGNLYCCVVFNLVTTDGKDIGPGNLILRSEQSTHKLPYYNIDGDYEIVIDSNAVTLYKLPASGGSSAPEPYYLPSALINLLPGDTDETIRKALGGDSGLSEIQTAINAKRPFYIYDSILCSIPVACKHAFGLHPNFYYTYESVYYGLTTYHIKYNNNNTYSLKVILHKGYYIDSSINTLTSGSTSEEISAALGGGIEAIEELEKIINDGNQIYTTFPNDVGLNANASRLPLSVLIYKESDDQYAIIISGVCGDGFAVIMPLGYLGIVYNISSNTYSCQKYMQSIPTEIK